VQWIALNPLSDVRPPARDGHAAVVLNASLLLFGGVAEPTKEKSEKNNNDKDDDDKDDKDDDDEGDEDDEDEEGDEEDEQDEEDAPPLVELNDLWIYEFGTSVWTKATVSGDIPTPRTGSVLFRAAHSADHVWLFGGFSSTSGWMSDLFKLSVLPEANSFRWDRVDAEGDAPTCRDKLVAATGADGRVWLFGGFGPLTDEAGDDGFGDGQTYKWFDELFLFEDAGAKFTRVACTDAQPRCAAAGAVVGNELFVFGGSFSRDPSKRSDELRSLALPPSGSASPSAAWAVVRSGASGTPSGRSFVSAVQIGGRFVVFGGKSRQDKPLGDGGVFFNGAWSPLPGVVRPTARQYFQLVQRDENTAMLFGGSGQARGGAEVRFNDLWLLRVTP
jgi:hypothetical protein